MKGYTQTTLGAIASKDKKSVISGPFGSSIGKRFFQETGIPVIRGNNLTLGVKKFVDDGFVFLTKEKADQLNCYAIEDDLVFTAVGTIGQVGLIEKGLAFEKYVISNKQLRVRLDKQKVNPLYAYYWFSASWIRDIIQKRNVGSTVPLINLTVLKQLPIWLPAERKDQDLVVELLESVSEKIELNNKINVELEAMAKLIYDYWFVQFDFPDENGKPYRSSGGKMVYNEELKREIPEGWDAKPLSKIVRQSNESTEPFANPETDFKHLSIPAFDDCGSYHIEKGSSIQSNKFVIRDTDVLVSKLNPKFSRVIYAEDEENLISSTEFVVWRTEDESLKNYLFFLAQSDFFRGYCIQNATGTSNSHKRVNPTVMMRCKVPYQKEIASTFGKTVSYSIQLMLNNRKQNQELATLRDWLLPMLMNGQVKVGAAQEVLKAAEPEVGYGK